MTLTKSAAPPPAQQQPQSPAQLWTAALEQLQRQMTQATFDSWVKDTHLITANNGTWQIGVKSEFAKEWLENRLLTTIQRTVANLVGHGIELDFVVDTPEPEPVVEAVETESAVPQQQEGKPGEAFEVIFARDTDFYTPKKEIGRWLPEWQYDNLFWSPYLGKAYPFYRHLLMAWTKNVRKSDFNRLNLSNPNNRGWTPPFKLSYREATRWLGKSNQKLVPGGKYECHRSDMHARLGVPLTECCGAHCPHEWRPADKDGGRCYYWRPGLLHRLFDEQLLAIEISGTRRATIQVWRTLPLLTPCQVGQLNDFLQDQHDRWLERHGHLFNISSQQWSAITLTSLLPWLPGHPDRELQGQPPQNPLK